METPTVRPDDRLAAAERWVVAVAIAAAALLVSVAVFLRYGLGYSVSAFDEITRYLMICIAFVGASRLLHQDGHVSVVVLLALLPARARRVVEAIAALAGALFCLGLVWLGAQMLAQSLAIDLRSMSALRAPMWVPQAMVPLGAALMALRFLQRFGRIVGAGPASGRM